MRFDGRWQWAFFLFTVLCPIFGKAQMQAPEHPLEALKSQEYWTVYEVLQASGKIDANTYYGSVLFHEPPKEKVVAWKAGDLISREADVVLLRKGLLIEARLDIAARKLESWREMKGVQAPIIESEFRELGEVAKNDPRLREALTKRGITDLTTVECVPLPFGYFALPELEGHRIMYGGCSDLHGAFLSWGRSIEGLHFELDAVDKKVLRVIDEGPIPVPSGSTNYEEAAAIPRAGTTPISIAQPLGPGFQIKNGEVRPSDFEGERPHDPELTRVARATEVIADPELTAIYAERKPSDVTIYLRDGSTLHERVEYCRGEPENPPTPEVIIAKFNTVGGGHRKPALMDEIADRILHIEREPNLARLGKLLSQ